MPKFSYIVKDSTGKKYTGVENANSKDALITKLQQKDYFIVSVTQLNPSAALKKKQSTKKRTKKFGHKKVKLQDLVSFARQLATMMEAGVPLIRCLSVIRIQVESKLLYDIMISIEKNIEQGGSLSAALSAHPKVFNQFWTSLIEVGEASGTMPTILNKLTFYLEQQAKFRSTIISGIIYPAILFIVSLGAIAFFALVVGPKFEKIFISMDIKLPWITVTLLSTFSFIKTNIFKIIGSIVIAVYFLKKYFKTYNGRFVYERILFRMPVIGDIYQLIIVERFSSQMSILIDSGVPILYALDITERLVDNNTCALIVNDIKECVKQGEFLVAPMERSEFFPPMCIQMITVGEETGELSKMLKHVAAFYQDKVETFMARIATIIEPFMLVFMGGIIGVIVVAMLMPMFSISSGGR